MHKMDLLTINDREQEEDEPPVRLLQPQEKRKGDRCFLPAEERQPENGGKTLLPPVSKKDSRHNPLLWLLDEGGELRKAVDARARRKVAGSCWKSARRAVAAPLSRPTAAHKLEGDAAAELAGTRAASEVRQGRRSAEIRR